MSESIGSLIGALPAEQRTCDEHGDYLARSIAGRWTPCPVCNAARMDAQRRLQQEQDNRDRAEMRIAQSGIPPRFVGCGLDNYRVTNDGQRKALDFALELSAALSERAEAGRSAVFCGRPGNGKTHLACAIASAAIHGGRDAVFTTAIRLVRRIKETWSRDSVETESEAIRSFVRPDLLVIDEIGVQFGSETEKLLLFDVLNDRYEQRKSVVLVSNLAIDGVKEFLGERVFDRLREDDGVYIPFTWDSYRGS